MAINAKRLILFSAGGALAGFGLSVLYNAFGST